MDAMFERYSLKPTGQGNIKFLDYTNNNNDDDDDK